MPGVDIQRFGEDDGKCNLQQYLISIYEGDLFYNELIKACNTCKIHDAKS